jgi:hypothetical protein
MSAISVVPSGARWRNAASVLVTLAPRVGRFPSLVEVIGEPDHSNTTWSSGAPASPNAITRSIDRTVSNRS